MSSLACQVGIDVDSRFLVISVAGRKAYRVPNEEEAIGKLSRELPEGAQVHLESSGGYERIACRLLGQAGFEVLRHNPLKTRRYAQACGSRAKTDPVDAQSLARSGCKLPVPARKSLERQQLADVSRSIEALKTCAGRFQVRAKLPDMDSEARKALLDSAAILKAKAAALHTRFAERVKASESAAAFRLAQSVPCIGEHTARIAVAELPEDYAATKPGKIVSYAGLAPIDDSSGKRAGARLGRGNVRLKAAFYMPAICAIVREDWAKELYHRLRARGRAHQQAIVAVMRRLLLRVLAVLQRGKEWVAEPTP